MSDLFTHMEQQAHAKAERTAARKRVAWSKLTAPTPSVPKPPVRPSDPRRPESQIGSLKGEGIGTSAQWGKGRRHPHTRGNEHDRLSRL